MKTEQIREDTGRGTVFARSNLNFAERIFGTFKFQKFERFSHFQFPQKRCYPTCQMYLLVSCFSMCSTFSHVYPVISSSPKKKHTVPRKPMTRGIAAREPFYLSRIKLLKYILRRLRFVFGRWE